MNFRASLIYRTGKKIGSTAWRTYLLERSFHFFHNIHYAKAGVPALGVLFAIL